MHQNYLYRYKHNKIRYMDYLPTWYKSLISSAQRETLSHRIKQSSFLVDNVGKLCVTKETDRSNELLHLGKIRLWKS